MTLHLMGLGPGLAHGRNFPMAFCHKLVTPLMPPSKPIVAGILSAQRVKVAKLSYLNQDYRSSGGSQVVVLRRPNGC